MTSAPIRTPRLDLVAQTPALADADLAAFTVGGTGALARLLGAAVPPSWPPGEYDLPALTYFADRLRAGGAAVAGWYGWYALLRAREAAREGAPVLVGFAGFVGPPSGGGEVEIGYSVVEGFQRRGYATEMARALVARAFATPGVARVRAHTFPDHVASIRVLERCGMVHVGVGEEAGTVRYAAAREDAARG